MDIMKKNPKDGRPPKSASEKLKERLIEKIDTLIDQINE